MGRSPHCSFSLVSATPPKGWDSPPTVTIQTKMGLLPPTSDTVFAASCLGERQSVKAPKSDKKKYIQLWYSSTEPDDAKEPFGRWTAQELERLNDSRQRQKRKRYFMSLSSKDCLGQCSPRSTSKSETTPRADVLSDASVTTPENAVATSDIPPQYDTAVQ